MVDISLNMSGQIQQECDCMFNNDCHVSYSVWGLLHYLQPATLCAIYFMKEKR